MARLALFFIVFFMYIPDWAEESFITQYEYGQMLYKNPRGIGCINCHGKKGEGAVIAAYIDDGKKVILKGPDIRSVSMKQLRRNLKSRHRIMPTYFLTDSEIRAIYTYLHEEQ
ncbi:c-type cytochrome [Hydrogenimonas sp.]